MANRIVDNSAEVKKALKAQIQVGLEMIGLTAERYAKLKCPVDTGALRNSITHTVKDKTAYIGTNVEYGKYVELGTGIYASTGGGRKTPWAYVDGKGEGHITRGQKPQPFLKPAATEHSKEYRQMIEDALRK